MNLESDFADYYDDLLRRSSMDCTLVRNNRDELSHHEQLKLLREMGANTPSFGRVAELAFSLFDLKQGLLTNLSKELLVSVEGSNPWLPWKMDLDDAFQTAHEGFAVEYIINSDRDNVGCATRVLRIGDRQWCCEISNNTHYMDSDLCWRAGRGLRQSDVVLFNVSALEECALELVDPEFLSFFPMYMVDLVERDGQWFAVNFNKSPRLKETPFEQLPAEQIVGSLVHWFKKYGATKSEEFVGYAC